MRHLCAPKLLREDTLHIALGQNSKWDGPRILFLNKIKTTIIFDLRVNVGQITYAKKEMNIPTQNHLETTY